MKGNRHDKENDPIAAVLISKPSSDISRKKPGRPAKPRTLESDNEYLSKRKPGRKPQRHPLTEITQNTRGKHVGRPRLPDISTCEPKHATNKPDDAVLTPPPKGRQRISDIKRCDSKKGSSNSADATVKTHKQQIIPNNNSCKRTRTPTQLSPLSKENNNLGISDSAGIKSTPRPRGRPRLTANSTRTPFQDVTPVGSLTFKSTIVNGETSNFNVTGTSVYKKHAKRFMNQTPVNFDIESPSTEQVRASGVQSSLLTSDIQKLKGKMARRQSARRINFSEPVHQLPHKKDQGNKFVGVSKESMRGATNACSQSYSLCCGRGKVELTNEALEPPPLLKELITNKHPKSANFIDNIRRYNSMFVFTSMGGKQDHSVNNGRGPYCYRLHGENYHLAGPLLPENEKQLKFAQLYIYDTENEIQNRISALSNGESSSSKDDQLDYKLTTQIRDLLDEINVLVQDFRMAGERIRSADDKKNKP